MPRTNSVFPKHQVRITRVLDRIETCVRARDLVWKEQINNGMLVVQLFMINDQYKIDKEQSLPLVMVTTLTCFCQVHHTIRREFVSDVSDDTCDENLSSQRITETPCHSIMWFSTESTYRGKGFGMLTLLYSILRLKQLYRKINWLVLDDMSDRSHEIMESRRNIYNKFEFQPVHAKGRTKLRMNHSRHGPEMQLCIHHKSGFLSKTMPKLIREIEHKLMSHPYLRQDFPHCDKTAHVPPVGNQVIVEETVVTTIVKTVAYCFLFVYFVCTLTFFFNYGWSDDSSTTFLGTVIEKTRFWVSSNPFFLKF